MGVVEILMPRMGESVMEGTILSWLKKEGEYVEEEESLLEVATDKVDTDIPSPFEGVLKQILVKEGDVVKVDAPIALIETDAAPAPEPKEVIPESTPAPEPVKVQVTQKESNGSVHLMKTAQSGRFYSPLVLNIARKENIAFDVLERIPGSGKEGRVTKRDILNYLENPQETVQSPSEVSVPSPQPTAVPTPTPAAEPVAPTPNPAYTEPPKIEGTSSLSGEYEIIEMDRMRKIIAERMVDSKKISPHVTSFIEADVSNIVAWRNKHKNEYMERYNTALTYTPIFIEAVVKAIHDYPMINVSVEGDSIIVKKQVNIGMAVALPSGNLIVPVIKNADQLNLIGLTKQVNDLAKRARANQLRPEELEGGTYTVTNVGSFGNMLGTPIIVQPQVGILALGAVIKKPSVIETDKGDTIGIRHKMFLSHSYDHRVVDGSLGGMFVRRVADYLEKFDPNRTAQ